MTKKVVIAAAGQGTRMLHLTNNKCKHLIKVRKRPFLSYLLDNLFRAGYRELILVVGYKEDLIKDFLKEYLPPLKSLKKGGYRIIVVSQYEILGPKEKEYGTACPLKCVKDIVGKNTFIYLCGDNLYSVRDLKAINKGDRYNYIGGIYNEHPEKYGVLVSDKDFLIKIIEKPKEFVGNLINTGLYRFNYEIFDKVFKIKKSKRGEYEITDAINLLAKEKKVKIKELKDKWLDFGNPADIIKVSKFLKSITSLKRALNKNGGFKNIPCASKRNN
ncbi:MAG: sugar phosphate nucleotidyltransferase [Candidatus Pacebacteria bacterium]|nr:sugar phosphate nucleotidyltransferase [Candidatus Paceibacterota bacterium]